MSKQRNILILFAGGSLISIRKNKSIFFVENDNDISSWLSEVPEATLLTPITTQLIQGESDAFSITTIERIARVLIEKRDSYDGFVVLLRAEYIPVAASALEFMLQGFGKPIVCTGSRYSPESIAQQDVQKIIDAGGLGLRSNLINALQVATRTDFPAVGVMFGNKLIQPTRTEIADFYSINLFKSVDERYIGKVDFGITLRQEIQEPAIVDLNDSLSRTCVIIGSNQVGDYSFVRDLDAKKKYTTLLLHVQSSEKIAVEALQELKGVFSNVVLYNQYCVVGEAGTLALTRVTWSAAIAKVLWADARARDQKQFAELLQRDCVGEYITT